MLIVVCVTAALIVAGTVFAPVAAGWYLDGQQLMVDVEARLCQRHRSFREVSGDHQWRVVDGDVLPSLVRRRAGVAYALRVPGDTRPFACGVTKTDDGFPEVITALVLADAARRAPRRHTPA